MTMEQGYTQIYTGNGKGKTTAALGLCLRAAGAGLRVYFGQFMKTAHTSEAKALSAFAAQICHETYGTGDELARVTPNADKAAAQQGLEKARAALLGGAYDLVVLDEINVAQHLGYISEAAVLALISEKPRATELVLTGRSASQAVLDAADLVTEMCEVKHYYHAGVFARKGIEH